MASPDGPKEDLYIDVPLGGLETGLDAERVEAGKALVALNVAFREDGVVTRCPSFSDLDAAVANTPRAIAPMDDKLVVFTKEGTSVVYNTDTGTEVVVDTVTGAPVPVRVRAISHGGRPSTYWSSAVVGNVMCVVYLAGDTDYGQSAGDPTQTDDAAVMFMLLDARTGDVLKKPTVWAAATSVQTDLAVPTVRAINGFFVIACRMDFSVFGGVGLYNWFFNVGSAELHIGAIDTSGAVTSAKAVLHADMMQYDFHAEDGQAFGFVYVTTWTSAVLAAQGASTLYRINVSAAGVITTAALAVTAAAGAHCADAMPIVFHNTGTGSVLMAFFDAHTANASVKTCSCSTALAGLTVPVVVHAVNGGKENDVQPWNEFALGTRTYQQMLRATGGFVKLTSDGTDCALLWNGFASMDATAANIANANYGFPAQMTAFHPCGIRHTFVDGTTGASNLVDPNLLLVNGNPLEAQLMMVSKPWFDGDSAYVLCATAPPVNFLQSASYNSSGKYHASRRDNFNSFTYQPACFVAQIPSSYTRYMASTSDIVPAFLVPKSVFNVDKQQHPIIGSMWVLPQVYSNDGAWKCVTQVELDFTVPPSYSGYETMYGTSGALVFVSTDSTDIQALSIDGGIWLSDGAQRLFDGMNTTLVPMPSVQGYALLSDAAGLHTPPYTMAFGYKVVTYNGKTLRSGICEAQTDNDVNWWQYAFEVAAVPGENGDVYAFHPPFAGCLFSTNRNGSAEPQGQFFYQDSINVTHTLFNDTNFFYRLFGVNTPNSEFPSHYMDSGELGAELPAGAICGAVRRDRVFYVDCDDVYTVRSSKLIGQANWVEFNQNLYVRIPDTEGGITALATMDDKLLIFTDTAVHYLVGEGPNNVGRGGWDAPRKIASSLGCIDKRSVISCDLGVAFLSRRGLELLDRGLSLSALGSPAQQYFDEILAGTRTLCGAVNVGKHSELRWVTENTDGNTDLIVYNYDTDRWAVWNTSWGVGATATRTPLATCVVNDVHFILVERFTSGVSQGYSIIKEIDTFVEVSESFTYTTSWLKLQGQQDYFRAKTVFLSGYWPSMAATSSFQITATFDYGKSGANDETHTVTAANLTRNASGYFEAKIALQNQKCESVKLSIVMAYGTGGTDDENAKIVNLGLEVAPMEGGNKMPYTTTTVS